MMKLPRPAWHIAALLPTAFLLYQKLVQKKRHDSPRSDWWAVGFSFKQLTPRIQAFIDGNYLFSPMRQFQFENETIRIWQYDDRIIMRCLFNILKPTFSHILSKVCYHLKGPLGVKLALRHIENALAARLFRYAIRLDIKDYYASISHSILIQQIQQQFHDPKVLHYLTHIVDNAVDDGGNVFLPKLGIPRRSCFSPFFGALYLLPLDRAFEQRNGCFYVRFMDDILILFQTQRQFRRGRRTLFNILRTLKLKLSPRKSWMGKLRHGFHFLGVRFSVTKPKEQSHRLSIAIHPRSCARALDHIKALISHAGDPATSQRYLVAWGRWWTRAVSPLSFVNVLCSWVAHARDREPSLVWLGTGLLLFHWCRDGLCGSIRFA